MENQQPFAISPVNIQSGQSIANFYSAFNQNLGVLIGINARLNEVAGNPAFSADLAEDEVHARIRHQCGLIVEEAEETLQGLSAGDVELVRDGLADVLVTVTGLLHRAYPTEKHTWEFDKALFPGPVYYPTETLSLAINSLSNYGASFKKISQGEMAIDMDELRQACFHLVTFVQLFATITGIPLFEDHAAVSRSNMSKFDTDRETAELTVAKYAALGIDVEIRETVYGETNYFVVVSAKDQEVEMFATDGTSNGIRQFPKGKFLKSVNYQEPVYCEAEVTLPSIIEQPQQDNGLPAGEAANDDAQ